MSHDNTPGILSEVATYYSDKLAKHGDTPLGVDWNGTDSQLLRFRQLCKVISTTGNFSINDLGCGYGALLHYLQSNYQNCSYLGVDVSSDMILAASERCAAIPNSRFITAAQPDSVADYSIASGIFNVRQARSDDEWYEYLVKMLDCLDCNSKFGFSFNCLTSYSDSDKKRDYLYYADPLKLFDLCKRRFSREVALHHDYGLYEFTIIVRKFL